MENLSNNEQAAPHAKGCSTAAIFFTIFTIALCAGLYFLKQWIFPEA